MRRAGNTIGTPPDEDPNHVCHHHLFGETAHDNGDGTCTYGGTVTCPYGDMPSADGKSCQTDRCTRKYALIHGGIAAAAAALAGYGIARAAFPAHTARGAIGGAVVGAVGYTFYSFNHCLFGDSGR